MKHIRKLVTLLLVLTMVISSIGVFAEETATQSVDANTKFSDIEAGSKVESAVTKLVAYNIISGYPDGTFRPDGQITRAEFAAVITRFEGIAQNLGSDAVTGFEDLDNDTQNAWARPYVKAAVDAGIINGFDDGTFRAGEPVTYEQAIKMIICAIDYQIVANSELARLQAANAANITWSSGYISAANKNNITVGAMTANVTEPATRGTVAILTSNALSAPTLTVKDDGTVSKAEEEDEKITELDGIVTGTYLTGVDEQAPDVNSKQLRIRANKETQVYDLSDSVLAKVDFEDILGKRVLAYYDNQEGQITSLTVNSSNETTVINEESIIRPISGSAIKYEKSNGKTETVSLSDYTVIWNGKYIEELPDMETAFRNGTIELVETSGSSLAKITSYDVFVVNSYDKTNAKIYFKYGKTYNGEEYYEFPAKTSEKPQIFVNGSKKEFSSLSLAAYNVINLMESPAGAEGEAIRKMYVTTGAKSGTVTAGLDEERIIELDGKNVYLTNDYSDYTPSTGDEEKAPFEREDTYTYYLDYTGQIAAVKYSASTNTGSYNYGYIVAVGEVSGTPSIRFMSKSGITDAYPLKSSVKIDGEKVSDDNVFDALEDTAKIANKAYNTAFGASIGECYQPVRYSLSGGSVDAIDTLSSLGTSTSDNLSYDAKLTDSDDYKAYTTTTSIKTDSTTYAVSSSTVVIFVPDNRTDRSSYEYMTPSQAFATSKDRYVEVLGVDASSANKLAKFVLVYRTNPTLTFAGNSPYMVVTKVPVTGEKFTGYRNASSSTTDITVSDDAFYSDQEMFDENTSIENIVAANEVNKGDIIRYITKNSAIVAIEKVYDAEKKAYLGAGTNKTITDTTGSSTFSARYGEVVVYNDEEKTISVTTVLKGVDEGDVNEKARTYNTSSTKIYELSGGEVTLIDNLDTVNDITTATPTRVIVISNDTGEGAAAKVIYVIKD